MTKGEALRNRMVEVYDVLRDLGLDDVKGEMRATSRDARFECNFRELSHHVVKKLEGLCTMSAHGSEPFMCQLELGFSTQQCSLKIWRRLPPGTDNFKSASSEDVKTMSQNSVLIEAWLVRSTNYAQEEE